MERTEQKRLVYTRWQESGLSRMAFCKREQISYASFNYWHKQFSEEKPPAGFSEVVLSPPSSCTTELIFPSGVRMVFHSEPPAGWLKELLY